MQLGGQSLILSKNMSKKNKWNIIKVLLENYLAEGMNRKKIVKKVANDLEMTPQNIYLYMSKNKFTL